MQCPFCQGAWLAEGGVELLSPGVCAQLAPEARHDSAAFAKVRRCPECARPMTPWRIGMLEAWLEKCPACERYWAEKQDLRTLEMIGQRHARAKAMKTFTPEERRELAGGLAQSVVDEDRTPDLSPLQWALMFVGVPSVTRVSGTRVPWVTWLMSLAIAAVFVAGKFDEDGFGPLALAFDSARGEPLLLFTATFAHFSWFQVLGNLAFLAAFGDGVEQRVPRWMLIAAFVFVAPLFTLAEVSLGAPGAVVGGASGAVAMVMGACVVLQPKARVWFLLLGRYPLYVPILGFGVLELLFQSAIAMLGIGDVAWWAHLSGLAFGLVGGLVLKAAHASSVGRGDGRLVS